MGQQKNNKLRKRQNMGTKEKLKRENNEKTQRKTNKI